MLTSVPPVNSMFLLPNSSPYHITPKFSPYSSKGSLTHCIRTTGRSVMMRTWTCPVTSLVVIVRCGITSQL
jgi:hypothetical protein